MRVYDGDYDYYLFKREELAQREAGASQPEQKAPSAPAAASDNKTLRHTHVSASEKTREGGKKTKEQRRAEAEARTALNKKLKSTKSRLAQVEKKLEADRKRYDELMELMASEELYADQEKFNQALAEYNGLKQEIPALEDEWLELSTKIEEETARGLA